MPKLTKSDVLHIASLSKLNLTELEIKKYLSQISKIVDFISQLQEVNTKNVEPTTQTTGLTNVLRKDEINTIPMLSKNSALSGTDDTHNGLFKVSAILENRTQ